jgi:long-chain acyl-CoA synthetase
MSNYTNILTAIAQPLNKPVSPLRFVDILRYRHQNLQKVAIIERGQKLTYTQLWQQVDAWQTALAQQGIAKGDVVAVCSSNSIATCIAFLAIWQYGAVPFIVNYKLETLGSLCDLNIRFYLVPTKNPAVHRYFKSFEGFTQNDLNETFRCYKNTCSQAKLLTDTAILVTSSGSSGKAKIVKLTERGTLFNVKSNIKALSIETRDVSALILPLGYSYGLVGQLLSHLYMGASVVLLDTVFFITQISEVLNLYQVTNLFMVPPMIRQINYLHSKNLLKIDCPTLRFITIGGNRIETSSVSKVMDIFKCPVIKTYGLAEAGPRVATNIVHDAAHQAVESVGKANQGVGISILFHHKNHEANTGIIKIESPSVMAGYFNFRRGVNIVPHKSVITKDIGYLDADGNLFILGRKDNYFKIGKQSFWYREVENLLYQHFPFLKISLQKSKRKIVIKVVAMYDFVVNTEEVMTILSATFGPKANPIFSLEVLKTNTMLNEK